MKTLLAVLLLSCPAGVRAEAPESLALSGESALRGAGLGFLGEVPAVPLRGEALRARPPWLSVEGLGSDFAEAERRLLEAADIVGRTPTGRGLAGTLAPGRGRVFLRENGSFMVSDDENAVIAGPGFVNSHTPRALAALFAHELEHLVQGQAGVKGEKARGARELGAFLVQCRVWVEAGAPVEDGDWERNAANSQDMWAWLEHPYTAMAVLALRGSLDFDLSRKDVKAYWERVLDDEARWRGRWSSRFPRGRDGREAALFILEQGSIFAPAGAKGDISSWLPAHLERMSSDAALPVPGDASAKDRAYIRTLRSIAAPRP